ncbi:MAG TPA: alanine--tRNA ligase, partial [Taishania sp.]|nr:alanine--tRNA ligase [Taishania sp.]
LFQTLIHKIESISGLKYGVDEPTDIALRVIADHVRAIAFSIADGQLPSNTGAGYVIRRILRRAVRYGYSTLNLKEPFLCELSITLSELMGGAFPELISQKELVYKVIKEEELSFFRTLEQGIRRIDALMQTVKAKGETIISGADVFELYDTYGFPIDLTSLIARENNLSIDSEAFEVELNRQKDRSRAATALETDDWQILTDDTVEEFIGYDHLTTTVNLVKYRKVIQKQKEFFQLVFNLTPFYPEGGGQVGDKGYIEANGEKVYIFDTKKENNLIVHLVEKLPMDVHATFSAVVDKKRRFLSMCHHSATHLLHHALRTVLGTHVEQKGSLVSPEYLRFDFSHFAKVTDEQLAEVERLVIEAIRRNYELEELRNAPMEVAKEMGAMALFGEKYGDTVRVIKFGESIELCGGTHVTSTGQIGLFKIVTETAVAAGIRRIEAITSEVAENYYKERSEVLGQIAVSLKNPKDLVKAVTDLQTKNHELQKEIERLLKERVAVVKQELKSKVQSVNGTNFLGEIVSLDAGSIKDILFQLKGEFPSFIGILGGKQDDKCSVSVIVTDDLIQSKNLHAGNIIKEVAPLIQGGGGGQPFYATAGGKNANGLTQAIETVKGKL